MKAKIIEELNKVAGHTVVKHIADEFADNILKILQFENLCNHPELAEMHMYDSLELMNSDSSNLEQTTEQPKEVQHISAADKSLIGAWIHLADYSRYSGVVEIPVYDNQRELFIKALQHFISTCDNSTHDEKGNVSAEERLSKKLDEQEYTYDLSNSSKKSYPRSMWIQWMEEFAASMNETKPNEGITN